MCLWKLLVGRHVTHTYIVIDIHVPNKADLAPTSRLACLTIPRGLIYGFGAFSGYNWHPADPEKS